jgi:hypothetical protein
MRNVFSLYPWQGCRIQGDDFARLLAESPTLANVRRLVLGSPALTPAGLEALTQAPHLRGVAHLGLGGSKRLGDEGARLLACWPFAEGLLELSVRDTGLSRRGAEYLAASAGLAPLRELHISDNAIGDDGLAALARSPYLTELRKLFASRCDIGSAGATALAEAPFLPKLLALSLSSGRIRAAGAKALFGAEMPCLEYLDLNHNEIGRTGVGALVRSRGLDSLRRLHLEKNRVGDTGARHLARWPGLAGLTKLILGENEISDDGARALLESPHRRETVRVDLRSNPLVTIDLPAMFLR